jgi:RimJ/RimL family protein N-acetyltransferase
MANDEAVTLRQAIPQDAQALQRLLQQLGQETPYLELDVAELAAPVATLATGIARVYDAANNLLLLALSGETPIGLVRVQTADTVQQQYSGEVGIAILKDYWGLGLGQILLSEMLAWAQDTALVRLALTVQTRNQRARHLYEKLGFKTEGILEQAIYDPQAGLQDVAAMAYLLKREHA